jgi:hypothetical protein
MQRLFILLYFYGMKYTVFALMTGLLIAACNNNASKTTNTTAAATDSIAPQQDFFPVPDYIGGQLKIIDSLQLPISKSVTVNNNTQLSVATDKELRELAQNFRQPDISDPALKKFYHETSIADQSVPSVTFIYTTTDTTLQVQKINVYVKPDPVQNDKVTGIYIEKTFNRNDTSFTQKLYWKTGKNMQIITEKQVKGKSLPVEQVKITWDYTN